MGYTQLLSVKNPRQRRWDGALNLLVLCLCVHVCLCKPVCVCARVHVCVCLKAMSHPFWGLLLATVWVSMEGGENASAR